MLKTRLMMAAVLATLIAGPALAAEPADPASEPTPKAAAESILPAEITSQITPAPTYRYGMKQGPCFVSVPCIGNYTISCSGQTVCYWKYDSSNPNQRGFVECDGQRTTCSFEP